MSLADKLLAAMSVDVPEHDHNMIDPDSYFVIDPDSREIMNAGRGRITIMQYDHNSEIFTFELPRYIEGHDMLLCNRVRVHFNNVDGKTNDERRDVAEMYDLAPSEKDPTKLISTWCVRREATQLAGTLNFLVQYECIDDGGESVYEWHTDIFTEVYVKAGRNFGEQAVVEYSNVLEQWYQKLFGAGDSVIANIASEGEKQIAAVAFEGAAQKDAIVLKGEETLASIPADYTTTYNMAEEALRRKANAIEQTAEGEVIFINDSADACLLGLNIYGRTAQVTTTGKNLCSGYKRGAYGNSDGIYSPEFTGYHCSEKTPVEHGVNYVISNGLGSRPSIIHAYDADDSWLGPINTLQNLPENVAYLGANYLTTDDLGWVQIEVGTEATEYEPYSGGVASPNPSYPQELESVENPVVSVYGKNLVNLPESYTYTQFGMVDVNIPAGEYVFSYESESHTGTKSPSVRFLNNDAWKLFDDTSKSMVITLFKDETQLYFYSNGTAYNGSAGFEATINRFMISKDGGEYEPYKTVQTLSTSHTLPGLPVTTGGNYVDSNGQQWVCDEIDFERGVYIQRVKTRILNGSESWWVNDYQLKQGYYVYGTLPGDVQKTLYTTPVLSDKLTYMEWGTLDGTDGNKIFEVSDTLYVYLADQTIQTANDFKAYLSENPIEIQYVLATPIETPLTDEELVKFKMVCTHYHNTAVLNDHDANMAIKYATDTRMFFEKHSIATDTQVEDAVDAWLTKHFSDAEEVSF